MPFVPTPNVVQYELRADKGGEFVENRLMINVFHTPTPADLLSIATVLNPLITNEWLPLLPTDVTFREAYLKSLHSENDIEATYPFAPTNVGTATGEPLPNNVTICVSLRSAFTGRSARGRLYWLGLSVNQVATNVLEASAQTDIPAAVNAVRAALTEIAAQWVIVSYRNNNAPRVGGPVYFTIQNALLTDATVDSQRRRLPGRGN